MVYLNLRHHLQMEASTIKPTMDDITFENPTFDPDGPGVDDDYSFNLPDPPMEPPPDVQHQLNASGDNLQNARGVATGRARRPKEAPRW